MKRSGAVVILFLSFLGLWAAIAAAAGPAVPEATYVAGEYRFDGPDTLPAGWVTLRITNAGHELHQLQVVKLADKKSVPDIILTLTEHPDEIPSWMHPFGGPNGVMPGGEALATVHLAPGQYLLICLVPDKDGVFHVIRGMHKAVTVTPTTGRPAKEPKAAVTITAKDYVFIVSGEIRAGDRMVRVDNVGTQPHEVLLVELPSDKTIHDFAVTPPESHDGTEGRPVGGLASIGAGMHGYFSYAFRPGRYGIICLFPDEIGRLHFTRGMLWNSRSSSWKARERFHATGPGRAICVCSGGEPECVGQQPSRSLRGLLLEGVNLPACGIVLYLDSVPEHGNIRSHTARLVTGDLLDGDDLDSLAIGLLLI